MSLCKGPCGRKLPRAAFDRDAQRHWYKVCRECQFPACATCDRKSEDIWTPPPSKANAICVMDPCPQFICMLPCRSLTRYASTSKEKLSTILHSFHIVSHEIGLFQNDPQQWEFLAQGARLRCFTQIVLPLIQASHRLSNYKALWLVVPKSVPHFLVGQEKGKG